MKPTKLIIEIEKLGLSEKLILVEDIWDAIAKDNSELPMPEWQKAELDKRYADYQTGKIKLHDWESLHEDLRKKYK